MTNREITQQNQPLIKKLLEKDFVSDSILVAVFASFITFLQPFGMVETPWLYAWSFWLCICLSGYCIFTVVIKFVEVQLSKQLPMTLRNKQWFILTISTLIASFIMAFVAQIIIGLFFDAFDRFWHFIIPSFFTSLLIGGILTIAAATKSHLKQQKYLIQEQQQALENQPETDISPSAIAQPLINKLPIEKRGVLYCLEMDDHYLKVHTDKGNHLILMRLKDAIDLLKGYPGSQVHRSWWVAHEAILVTKKDGRKITLSLVNGLEVPVSKTYEENVKAHS